jgi:CBS domain-containing protein
MKQTVREWMISPVVVVPPDASVDWTVRLMRDRGIHNVVVDISPENGRGYGIVTTTDIFDKIVTQDRDPSEFSASEVMAAPIECAETDWTLRQAFELMHEIGVNYLPVEDEREQLVGVISAAAISLAASN